MKRELILILDFGGQNNQLIARCVRNSNVYCEVVPYDTSISQIKEKKPMGIIFTGGVYEATAAIVDKEIFELGIPILGICYGLQLIGHLLGGEVTKTTQKEYGKIEVRVDGKSPLFKNISKDLMCWINHNYCVSVPPANFKIIANSENCPILAIADENKKIYGVQFYPEVTHTQQGLDIIKNFLYDICNCKGNWVMSDFAKNSIAEIKQKIGDKKVLCALSGGVDSSVSAVLMHKAVGKQLTCIFVDHGLLRKNERSEVEAVFKKEFDINLICVDAEVRFLKKLAGISDPETKRKIIGEEFIRVFEEEAKKIGMVDYLVQGTIYPDIIESGIKDGAMIKSHHNVGGLPDYVDFKEIIEPLRELFKDEVRQLGRELGIPEFLVSRQPFPGPGLAVRVIGDITKEKLDTLREADFIYCDEIIKAGLDKQINQYFAILTNLRSVGVISDKRTYYYTVALRGVETTDFMTADWAHIPHNVLADISNRIVNEVSGVSRVVYDITSKPPATIEWE